MKSRYMTTLGPTLHNSSQNVFRYDDEMGHTQCLFSVISKRASK